MINILGNIYNIDTQFGISDWEILTFGLTLDVHIFPRVNRVRLVCYSVHNNNSETLGPLWQVVCEIL